MTCNDGVCAGVIAFGPPTGDTTGLGYCDEHNLDEADLVDGLLYEDDQS